MLDVYCIGSFVLIAAYSLKMPISFGIFAPNASFETSNIHTQYTAVVIWAIFFYRLTLSGVFFTRTARDQSLLNKRMPFLEFRCANISDLKMFNAFDANERVNEKASPTKT